MKSIIALLALVALTNADGSSDAFLQCAKEAMGFKQCIAHGVANATMKNMQKLKGFGEEIQKCFQQDGVKGICNMPTPPAHPPQGHNMPTPPPEFATCLNGAKTAFFTCFKKEAGIPADFKPPANAAQQFQGQGQFGPPPQMHEHFAQESPEAIKAKVLEICGNNQAAADKLTACAKDAIKPYLPALIAIAKPILVACQVGAVCAKTQPISADCRPKLAQGAKAFCTCRPEFPKFMSTSDACAAARASFKEHVEAAHAAEAQHVEAASAAHHDFPQHPGMPFDFCAQSPATVCKELAEKLEKAHAAFGVAPAPAPSS